MTPRRSRLLGIHSGALGDVILFARFLDDLRRPDTTVTLVAGGSKARLLRTLGAVDEALSFDSLPMHELFADGPADRLAERLGRCDRLISCFGASDAATREKLTALSGAACADFLPIRPPADWAGHLVELWWEQVGEPPTGETIAWTVPASVLDAGRLRLTLSGLDASSPVIVCHLGSGAPDKCWPPERFIELAGWLDTPVAFVLGPVERERMDVALIGRLAERAPVLVDLTLEELTGVLALASAFVCADSGPAHLAASVGTPTLVLFGPTSPTHFAPLGPRVRTIRREALDELTAVSVAEELHSTWRGRRGGWGRRTSGDGEF